MTGPVSRKPSLRWLVMCLSPGGWGAFCYHLGQRRGQAATDESCVGACWVSGKLQVRKFGVRILHGLQRTRGSERKALGSCF
eukprot:3568428-Pyramimonas_sp.AAC.1